MLKDNKNSKKVILSVIGLMVLIIAVIGVTYAAFVYTGIGSKQNTIQSGTIVMTYTENTNGITITNAMPMTDAAGKVLTNSNEKFEFTVSASITGTATINYEVAAIKNVSSMLLDNEVRLYLEKNGSEVMAPSNFTPIASTTTIGSPVGSMIMDSGTFTTTGTNNYVLRMWVAESTVISDVVKTYTVKVNVYGKDIAGGATSFTNGTQVYFNPETGTKCSDYTEANSTTGNKNGCMKWYVFNSDNANTTANLLLDHNTTATVEWSSTSNNDTGGDAIKAQLATDVTVWHSSVKTTARLISANEVASITGHPTFDAIKTGQTHFYFDTNTSTQSSTCTSGNTRGCSYGWLYDRTRNNCVTFGCLNNGVGTNTYGYWTSSPNVANSSLAWQVYYDDALSLSNITIDSLLGVRPVITVLKSKL